MPTSRTPRSSIFKLEKRTVNHTENHFRQHTLALQERERFFGLSQEMLLVASFDLTKRLFNSVGEKLGYTRHELEVIPLQELVHPEDLPSVLQQTEALKSGKSIVAFVARFRARSGHYHWLRWNAVPYLDEGLFYGAAQDITDQYAVSFFHSEQSHILRLLATGAELSQILNSLVQMVETYLPTVRAAILLLEADDTLLRLVASANLPQTIAQSIALLPNQAGTNVCATGLALRSRIIVSDIATHLITAPHAALWEAARVSSGWSQPIFASDGAPLGSLAFFDSRSAVPSATDMMLGEASAYLVGFAVEQRRGEEALQRSELRYRQVVTQTTEAIFLIDAYTAQIIEANDALCRMVGYTPNEICHLTLFDIVDHPRENVEANMAHVRREKTWSVGERLYRCKDGSRISVEASAIMLEENGRELFCVIARDITARKENEKQLRLLLTGARCLLWHAEIQEIPTLESLPERFQWQLCVSNEDAAQQFFPLETTPTLDYTELWRRSILPEHLPKMYERSSKAFLTGESGYSHEFQCANWEGVIFWFREDVRVEKIAPHRWRAVGVCTDVTRSKAMEQERDASIHDYQNLFANVPTGIYRTTPDGRILLANPALVQMLGYDSFDELTTLKLGVDERVGAVSRNEFVTLIEEAGEIQGWETTWQRKDGALIEVRENAKVIRDPHTGMTLYYEGSVEDITERKKAEEMIHWQATHDALTELPNRTLFYRHLEQALDAATEVQGQVGVLFIDLDRFKQINDTLGHAAGDRLLQEVARRLNRSLRTEEVIARISGDEFVVLLPRLTSPQTAIMTARKLHTVLSPSLLLNGHEVVITASVGISIFPQDGRDAETILANADVAMYRAKAQGGDSSQPYSQTMNATALQRLTMETSLRKGLARREFTLLYQPQVEMGTRRIVGVEALIRWNHPEKGFLEPYEFIGVAEETGLIGPLGEWVIEEVCRQAAAWRADGTPLRVSANLSARQFGLHDLAEQVSRELKNNRLPGHWLDLELTETAILEHGEDALVVLNALKQLGVRLVVDDFGTGYSSLRYLRKFPLDVLKVDQSFVGGMTYRSEDEAIVRAVIDLAHALGMEVIAEGVETEAQRDHLSRLGCEVYQGFLFSKPRTASQVSEILLSSQESAGRLAVV